MSAVASLQRSLRAITSVTGGFRRELGLALLALLILAILLVVLRGPALITQTEFNPDESELMAMGKLAMVRPFPLYEAYETLTLNFLSPLTVAALGMFGVPLRLPTAHLISGLSYLWWSWACWFLLAKRFGWRSSAVLVAGPVLLLFSAAEGDFAAMGTELLPLSAIVLAAVIALGSRRPPSYLRLALSSVLLGMAFWFKPQCLPLALGVLLVTFLLPRTRNRGQRTGITGGAAAGLTTLFLLPSAVTLLLLTLGGSMDAYLNDTVFLQIDYVTTRTSRGGSSPGIAGTFVQAVQFLVSRPLLWLWAVPALIEWNTPHFKGSALRRSVAVAVVPLVAAIASLSVSAPLFVHYLNIWIVACLVTGTSVVTLGRWSGSRGPCSPRVTGVLLLPVLLSLIVSLPSVRANWTQHQVDATNALNPPLPDDEVMSSCPVGSRVQVWGWASNLYSIYDWLPATRYATTNVIIRPADTSQRTARAFLNEVIHDPPLCIVEATSPDFFGRYGAKDSVATVIPEMTQILDDCYTLRVAQLQSGERVRVFSRNSTCHLATRAATSDAFPPY